MASLDEYIASRKPAPGLTERWFDEHPDLHKQVMDGLTKYPVGTIYRWLREEHGFPFSDTSLYNLRDRIRSAR